MVYVHEVGKIKASDIYFPAWHPPEGLAPPECCHHKSQAQAGHGGLCSIPALLSSLGEAPLPFAVPGNDILFLCASLGKV